MRKNLVFSPLPILPFLIFFFACGGSGNGEMDDAMADDPMAMEIEEEASPTEAQESPCWTQGDTDDRPSPLQSLTFNYEGGTGTLCYGAPSARERVVFGELVPFEEPWRLGANEATAIHLTGPATIGGVALEAGSYSLYVTPMEEGEWEFSLNSVAERWGVPINEEVMGTNIGSFTAAPSVTEEMVEKMTFTFEPWENERAMGDVVFNWENTTVKFHVHPAG